MTCQDDVALYLKHLETRNYSDQTRKNQGKAVSKFLRFAGEAMGVDPLAPAEVTPETIEAYKKHLALEKSPATGRPYRVATQRHYLHAVVLFYRWLEKEGKVLVSPAAGVDLPPNKGRRIGTVLSEKQAAKLVEAPNVSLPLGVRDRAILEVLYGTGLRVAELTNLTIYDVDRDAGTLRVQEGKGKKDRLVPLGKTAAYYVAEYLASIRSRYAKKTRLAPRALFLAQDGAPVTEKVIRYIVYKYARQTRVRASPHALRRSTATHLLASGASPEIVGELLGHSSLRSLHFYANLFGPDLKDEHRHTHPREKEQEP